jgi:hypothetical protein
MEEKCKRKRKKAGVFDPLPVISSRGSVCFILEHFSEVCSIFMFFVPQQFLEGKISRSRLLNARLSGFCEEGRYNFAYGSDATKAVLCLDKWRG